MFSVEEGLCLRLWVYLSVLLALSRRGLENCEEGEVIGGNNRKLFVAVLMGERIEFLTKTIGDNWHSNHFYFEGLHQTFFVEQDSAEPSS